MDPREYEVAVVGGGLAGLAAATLLARAGRRVGLFEKARSAGGRARSQDDAGFILNQGPHALYRGAEGIEVLRALGIEPKGAQPPTSGGYAVCRGGKHALPSGFLSLLTTSLLGPRAKLEAARWLTRIGQLDTAPLAAVTLADWLRANVHHPDVRMLLQALVRLTTYANDPARQSAGAALAQVQRGLSSGVLYLDNGWQSLVDALTQRAQAAGVAVHIGERVVAVRSEPPCWQVDTAGGARIEAACVLLALPPAAAADVVAEPARAALRRGAEALQPVRAACLDLGLSGLPRPRANFALGIDRPLYLSVHSAAAALAADGAALVHVAKYLAPDGTDAHGDEGELEDLMDLVQPGWRTRVVVRRFLPRMTVAAALVPAAGAGFDGRPGPEVPAAPGLYVAGDWVGRCGMLADASLSSAREAATAIGARLAADAGREAA